MSAFKNVVIAGLAAGLAAVAILAWREHAEIAWLRQGGGRDLAVTLPIIKVRSGTDRHVAFPSSRGGPNFGEDQRTDMFGRGAGFPADNHPAYPGGRRERSLAKLVENPEFVGALGIYQQSALDSRFAGLFRKLNLSGPELAEFKRLLAEKEGAEFDVVAVGESVADSPLPPEELRTTVNTVRAQVENEIRSALGADRYATYRDYERTLPQRATVAQLEQRLSYSPTPLTPAQSESMVQILAVHAPAKDPVIVAPTAVVAGPDTAEAVPIIRQNTASAVVSDEAVANAQTVLSAQQVAALQQIQAEQQSMMLASTLLRAAYPSGDQPLHDWRLRMQ